jgi:WD40 repeat protein
MNQQISLLERVEAFDCGAYVSGAAWLADTLVLALGDGSLRVGPAPDALEARAAHPDAAILVAVSDGNRIVTGGDDGRVVVTDIGGTSEVFAEPRGRWIDAIALGPAGALAWSVGKSVTARDGKRRLSTWEAPSSARGLAFAPKGFRLAVAHYNGASLWFPGTQAPPEQLEWKGSHLDVTWSQDARFIVTTMQENALHGWRLQPDKGHMRMSGYPAKTRSLSWSHDGAWLATSGADAAVIWPFGSKEGPTGKPPRECGVRSARVSRVAFHPRALVLATGYEDGAVLLIRLTDGAELMVRKPSDGGAVTAMAWDAAGRRLLFGCAQGAAGLLTLP